MAQIEAELKHLSADELRRLALKSWSAFVQKEGYSSREECSENDARSLAALNDAARTGKTNVSEFIAVRDHSAFLNSYGPGDEGLYDDAASR